MLNEQGKKWTDKIVMKSNNSVGLLVRRKILVQIFWYSPSDNSKCGQYIPAILVYNSNTFKENMSE